MADDRYRYLEELEQSEKLDGENTKSGTRKGKKLTAEQKRKLRQKKKRKRMLAMVGRIALLLLIAAVFLVLIHTVMTRLGGTGSSASGSPASGSPASTVLPVESSKESTAPATETPAQAETPAVTETPAVAPTAEPVPEESNMVKTYGKWQYSTDAYAPEGDIVPTTYQMYTYDRMRQDIYFLMHRYSDYCEVVSLATTADGRDIVDVVVGSRNAKKDVIIQYTIHAREYINVQLGMWQLESYLKALKAGEYADIWSDLRLHIIPMMNPDGVTLSQLGFDSVQNPEILANLKTIWGRDNEAGKGDPDPAGYCSRWKANMLGVDLNRNFDVGWETTGGSSGPSCTRYKGPSAASEIETQALVNLAKNTNCIGQIAYHSSGDLVYWDYGTEGAMYETDSALADTAVGLTGYKKTSTIASDQNLGGCSDYFILVLGIPAITIETGDWYDWPWDYASEWDDVRDRNSGVVPALASFFHTL